MRTVPVTTAAKVDGKLRKLTIQFKVGDTLSETIQLMGGSKVSANCLLIQKLISMARTVVRHHLMDGKDDEEILETLKDYYPSSTEAVTLSRRGKRLLAEYDTLSAEARKEVLERAGITRVEV